MTVDLRGVTTVLLPGTGSDDDYVYRAFSPALHAAGAVVVTPAPRPEHLIGGYRNALDEAADAGPVAVGGVSIGAAVAVEWALAHPDRTVGVLAVLPAWSGSPHNTPAAMTARHSAHVLRRDGLVAATHQMRDSSPRWLADELSRSWAGQWPGLPDAMAEAAEYVAPTVAQLETLGAPLGVVAATDDPVHPVEVAVEWVSAAPAAAVRTVTLDEMGADPAVLGTAAVAALREAAGRLS
ncbi:alpha/beta fold hydrolase [Mycobacterium sp. WMMD1722]|uniref:alpha/beta fold hydrolase n=1 Tax=Mycobacterium sp. WMMD1722 TaxID=3404117 RepID=UPI003BF5F85D